MMRLETKLEDAERRINQLESNQRWGVMAILALVFKSVMEFVGMQA